jgi:hypothetical protein
MAIVYIHYVFLPFFQFNSRKIALCHLMLKVTNFSWLWISSIFFACWFLVFLSCCYFFLFFYSCTTTTIGITITITNNSANEKEGTLETNYKLWSSEFQNFEKRKERTTPKLVLLPILSLGNTHTHTHTHTHTRFDCSTRSAPDDTTPHTLAFLVHGFWG